MKLKPVKIIAAVDANDALGNDGDLLFRNKLDLRHFLRTTKDNVVIMGRKTMDSIGSALSNRINIVVTKNPNYLPPENVVVAGSLREARAIAQYFKDKKVFVIGGGDVYKQALPDADEIILTRFEESAPNADTYFPEIPSEFTLNMTMYLTVGVKILWYYKK